MELSFDSKLLLLARVHTSVSPATLSEMSGYLSKLWSGNFENSPSRIGGFIRRPRFDYGVVVVDLPVQGGLRH